MRFLTAFCTASNRKTILTGTERMKQRPIGILVDALREIGAEISYLEKEGFPPIQLEKFEQSGKSEHSWRYEQSVYFRFITNCAKVAEWIET